MVKRSFRPVSALDIAADLANRMVQSQQQVVQATGVPVEGLLKMIELRREFSRRVLRWMGYRRQVTYYKVVDYG